MIKDYPTVFLSHSSKDSEIVERLAIDLRKHRIHAWYADWEIPSGSSLRRKIFEQGIDACDAFLVYLTEHAMNSNWVQEEMDSGFINLIEKQCLFLPIVDNYEVIDKLPSELISKKITVLSKELYISGLVDIITAIQDHFSAIVSAEYHKRIEELKSKIIQIKDMHRKEIARTKKEAKKELKRAEDHFEEQRKARVVLEDHLEKVNTWVLTHLPLGSKKEFVKVIKLPRGEIKRRNNPYKYGMGRCPVCAADKAKYVETTEVTHGGAPIGEDYWYNCAVCGHKYIKEISGK